MAEDQEWVERMHSLLAPNDIIRITFESGQELIISADDFRSAVDGQEGITAIDTFTPQEWEAAGHLPLEYDGLGQEVQETGEQTHASATDFQDRIEGLVERVRDVERERAQDRSEDQSQGRA